MKKMVLAASGVGRSATTADCSPTGMRFAPAAVSHGDVTSLSMDMPSLHGSSLHSSTRGGSSSRRLWHGQVSPLRSTTSHS
ncbi:hypothetical protein CUR178_06098 [Leishmania enriettii]|uniref:Uncharacterized protein n=1 Tax=Leishmania enriettii TaxID=5663 RepID=A0A836HJ33_LEIEN|nr:hypothetical protein CUR178_06098 [Leishmania enriettii]